jgi:hypothetical protein
MFRSENPPSSTLESKSSDLLSFSPRSFCAIVNDRRMAKSQEIIDSDWDFVGSERHPQSMYGKSLHYSDESLDNLECSDEIESAR